MRALSVSLFLFGIVAVGVTASHGDVEDRDIQAVLSLESDRSFAARTNEALMDAISVRAHELRDRVDRWQRSIARNRNSECDAKEQNPV